MAIRESVPMSAAALALVLAGCGQEGGSDANTKAGDIFAQERAEETALMMQQVVDNSTKVIASLDLHEEVTPAEIAVLNTDADVFGVLMAVVVGDGAGNSPPKERDWGAFRKDTMAAVRADLAEAHENAAKDTETLFARVLEEERGGE